MNLKIIIGIIIGKIIYEIYKAKKMTSKKLELRKESDSCEKV